MSRYPSLVRLATAWALAEALVAAWVVTGGRL